MRNLREFEYRGLNLVYSLFKKAISPLIRIELFKTKRLNILAYILNVS